MRKICLAAVAAIALPGLSSGQDYFVSPSGNDNFDGSSSQTTPGSLATGPFKSLERAQQAIRDLKVKGKFTESITIHILPGQYNLTHPLQFDKRDSGLPGREIHWQAEPGQMVISGGIELLNCRSDNQRLWTCPTSNLNLDNIAYVNKDRMLGDIPGFELFVNGERMQLARWPNTDWAHIGLPEDDHTHFTSMEKLPTDLEADSGTQVHIMPGNDWYDQFIGVAQIEASQNDILLKEKTRYKLQSGRRFYLRNIESQLDAPTEWYYSAKLAQLSFIAQANANPQSIVVSAIDNLIQINGADYLHFSGLRLRYSSETAIVASNTENLTFDEMEISQVGRYAIVAQNALHFSLVNSRIHDTGAGGIVLGGGDRNTLSPSANLIANNDIHHVGRILMTYMPGIEVSGVGATVEHNKISHSPSAAVVFRGNDHLLQKNEIHDACEQASDCGAIYTGRDWTFRGNVIRYNSIHDINGYGLTAVDLNRNTVTYTKPNLAQGIYLDDAASAFLVYGNILNNAGQMAIQLGGGRDTTIENNVIATNRGYAVYVDNRFPNYNWQANLDNLNKVPYQSELWRSRYPELARPMRHANWPEGNTITRNIIIDTGSNRSIVHYYMPAESNAISQNILWSHTGNIRLDYQILDTGKSRAAATWQEWQTEGFEKNSALVDPCAAIVGNQVSFCPESPAWRLGFQALPNDIGLKK